MRRIKKKGRKSHINYETYQMPNKWKYLTCIKVSISNQNYKRVNDVDIILGEVVT